MSAVYVVLYNARTLWHTIGLIGVVMACYGRKSRFADVHIGIVGNMFEVFQSSDDFATKHSIISVSVGFLTSQVISDAACIAATMALYFL